MEFPTGIKFIKEMTREELIEEIIDNQRAQLDEMKAGQLRKIVADFRITEVTKKIHAEAGLKVTPGVFGSSIESDEDEDDDN